MSTVPTSDVNCGSLKVKGIFQTREIKQIYVVLMDGVSLIHNLRHSKSSDTTKLFTSNFCFANPRT